MTNRYIYCKVNRILATLKSKLKKIYLISNHLFAVYIK